MPDSSVGVASRPGSPLPVTGQTADAPQVNVPIDDIYACLNRRHFSDGRKPFLGHQDFNGYRATGAADAEDDQDYVTLAQVTALIAAISVVPTGIFVAYTISSSTAPSGWLFANGQSVSRTTYAALWAKVAAGNNLAASEGSKTRGQYGPGNGSTTFTVPNLYADNGYFIRPLASGRTIGSVQADELKEHDHDAEFDGNAVSNHSHGDDLLRGGGPSTFRIRLDGDNNVTFGNTDSGGGHTPSGTVTVASTGGTETRPKNIAYPVIIKT